MREQVALPGGAGSEAVLSPRHKVALETALRLAHAAHEALVEAPASEADLRPIATSLRNSVSSICGGFDGAADPLASVRDAVVALDQAAEGLALASEIDLPLAEVLPWLQNARGWLLVVEEHHSRAVPRPLEPTPLYGTVDEPQLHNIVRDRLVPFAKVAEPKPRPPPPAPRIERPKPTTVAEMSTQLAELKAESEVEKVKRARRLMVRMKIEELANRKQIPELAPPGFTNPRILAITNARFIEARTRDCFEEVSMLGMQRAPLLGDPWRTGAFLERRMLASIDAIASLGSVALAALEPLVFDSPAKDASRGFGITMIAGCFVGRDAMAAAERAFRHLGPLDLAIIRAVAGALKLIPHPDLAHMLRAWSSDPNAGIRATAVEVLTYRGLITPQEVVAASQDSDPLVVARGVYAAGLLRIDELEEIVARGVENADPEVRSATYWAMAIGNSMHAADRIERELKGENEDAALMPLALAASQRHAETITERLELGLTKARILAAGWAGSPSAFPALLAGLDHADKEMALACALALDRICGANLIDQVKLPPERIDVPDDVSEPDTGDPADRSLARKVSDPRDLPSAGSPDLMTLPTTRRARWEQYFAREPSRYVAKLRYRRGLPYSPNTSLNELDRYALVEAERRHLQRELVIRTGESVRFDPHDFVRVQERALPEWAPHANRASSIPGSWSRPPRARR